MRNIGSATSYLEIRFDHGTVWSDGNSNGKFTIDMNTSGVSFTLTAVGYLYGQMLSGTNERAAPSIAYSRRQRRRTLAIQGRHRGGIQFRNETQRH